MGDLKMAFVNERTADGWRTVDREKGVYLTSAGGREKCRFFKLHIYGQTIPFEATYQIEKVSGNNANIIWSVERASIPLELQQKNKEIKDAILESLNAHGFGYQRNDIETVVVNISNTIPSLRA